MRLAILTVTLVSLVAACGGSTSSTETIRSENSRNPPVWQRKEHLPAGALAGARLFAVIGCLNCHSYLGTGGGFKGAPDLSREGLRHRGLSWQIRHLRCPSCLVSGSPMPRFDALGARRIRQLAIFLEASKGI